MHPIEHPLRVTLHPEHPTPVATATQSQSPVQPLLLDELLLDELLLDELLLDELLLDELLLDELLLDELLLDELLLDELLLDELLLDELLLEELLLEDELLDDDDDPPHGTTDIFQSVVSVVGQLVGSTQYSVVAQSCEPSSVPDPLQSCLDL